MQPPSKIRKLSTGNEKDPIPNNAVQFFNILSEICYGNCTLSGPGALLKYIYELPAERKDLYPNFEDLNHAISAFNGDARLVSIFVPYKPDDLLPRHAFRSAPLRRGNTFKDHHLPLALYRLQQRHGLRHSHVTESTADGIERTSRTSPLSKSSRWLRISPAFGSVFSFSLLDETEREFSYQIEIITIHTLPTLSCLWERHVAQFVDFDIYTGSLSTNVDGTFSHINFLDPQVVIHLMDHEITLRVHPHTQFSCIIHELIHNKKAGLTLRGIEFAPTTPLPWRNRFMDHFRAALAPTWINAFKIKTGINIPTDVIRGKIIPYIVA